MELHQLVLPQLIGNGAQINTLPLPYLKSCETFFLRLGVDRVSVYSETLLVAYML